MIHQSTTILGRIQPAVRMTQRGKWVKTDAQKYLAQQAELIAIFRQDLVPMPEHAPLGLAVTFYRAWLFKGDAGNVYKAVEDALQAAGIIKNDAYVVTALALKRPSDEGLDRTNVELWEETL